MIHLQINLQWIKKKVIQQKSERNVWICRYFCYIILSKCSPQRADSRRGFLPALWVDGGRPSPYPSLRKSLPMFTSLSTLGYGGTAAHANSGRKFRLFQRGYPLQSKRVPKSKKFSGRKFSPYQKQVHILVIRENK